MSDSDDDARLPAEARARKLIEAQLAQAGWVVQDKKDLNLFAAQGVAVREVVMKPGHGRVDYLLYVDKAVVGVIEAKPVGTPLSGVEWQSAMYADGLPADVRIAAKARDGRLPFVFEASGVETHFTNGFDPDPRARLIFNVPRPETLARHLREAETNPDNPTWRAKVRKLPALDTDALRPAQIEAINGVEQSLANQQCDRSLVQMATGAGKTFTAVTQSYRLLKHGGFDRILFLVDRNNLADQTLGEFQNYRTPDDGRRFTELYNVNKLSSAGLLGSTKVTISTIQRVFRFIKAGEVSDADDPDIDDYIPDTPVTVSYSDALPPETFDLVIVDEAHRSIYGVWRGVLEYFDAHVVGLTATPGKQTFAFFRQNLVSDYTYPESVADGVNVDFDVYRIRTKISDQGSHIDAGTIVPKVDRRTREQRLEALDDDLDYVPGQLDRAVTATDQIRTVLETFRDRLFTEIFPGRSTVPKTLIFAKDDNHAEEIVKQVREVFGKGNDFAAKITYNARNAKEQLKAFRTSPSLRIAVTVDMIATGTDVKPLECVFFMRDVRSAQYFEQMKGRGARTIPDADFQSVTPDAKSKTRFVIVDAIGVTEHDFVEPPLNRQRSVPLKKLLEKAANLTITEDEAATLASRLAKLELDLTDAERVELDEVAGQPVRDIIRSLVDAVEPSTTTPEAIEAALVPIASSPELRSRVLELRAAHDRIIDEVSSDELIEAGGVVDAGKARSIVESWTAYLDEHRDEITALQLGYEAGERRIDFGFVEGLAARIARPPHNWTPDVIWNAYAAVDGEKVHKSATHAVTDLVSLIRYATGVDDELVPYGDRVREKYAAWLTQQEQAGVTFSDTERWWLDRMVSVIASSAGIRVEDLDDAPFTERGGTDGAIRDLGDRAGELIDELNAELTA
ncbi:type I restriction endonuclease subunit R [Mycolicibacterium confluentis]|uniref:Type III restriction endonuclease subunit R n=1 Tax=Mycolicibacterium confluentis TaxID=28047 RepID=A0A7I7XTL4_9MYCO|nr:DEAD/DEAH box helicase family protein [Mycolicibacterium confluentis]MCV7322104.1 DEAD/DEAH box helicase family protein [Mycolicibacterium confluentis]ORV27787.1 DEAD/DEAH box helicase [Mycolicibacterium confluentis]BBZ32588.1 type III restriction endonuclease subunit R [Mycolicibacterium confluentis]